MIQPDHPTLSIVQQCRLASIGRSTFYHVPRGESAEKAVDRLDKIFGSHRYSVETIKARREMRALLRQIREMLGECGP